MKSHAEKCPICGGSGELPDLHWATSTCSFTKRCHGCGGRGWVVVKDIEEVVKEMVGQGGFKFSCYECDDSYDIDEIKSFVYRQLQKVRQEEKGKIVRKLEAIVAKNTDKEFGTDYDGLAEGVLAWLAEQRKKEK